MAALLQITIQDLAGPKLQALQAALAKPEKLLRAVGGEALDHMQANFKGQHDPHGNPWPKLRPLTLARRRKGGAHILRDTGRLANSICLVFSGNAVQVGTDVRYAPTHQFGVKQGEFGTKTVPVKAHTKTSKKGNKYSVKAHTKQQPIPWGNIPARPFIPDPARLPAELEADLRAAVERFILRAAGASQ